MNFFFFNDTATTEIYTLSLHDALPIFNFQILGFFRFRPLKTQKVHYLNSGIPVHGICIFSANQQAIPTFFLSADRNFEILGFFRFRPLKTQKVYCLTSGRSEEHTSELQSRQYLVCRLLLEKKKNKCTVRSHPSCSLPSCDLIKYTTICST